MSPQPLDYSAADVPITATCASYQHVSEYSVAPFLQRGCNRQPTGLLSEKLLDGQVLYGATNTGEPALMRIHIRLSKLNENDEKMDLFNCHGLISALGNAKIQGTMCLYAPSSAAVAFETSRRLHGLNSKKKPAPALFFDRSRPKKRQC